MPIPSNPVSLSDATKKSHYDTLYDNAILAETGGTAGGAQTVPGLLTLSGGTKYGVKAVASANYTITDTDGYQFILVTTGAGDRTITLPTAADNTGRILTLIKADSGAGHVIADGEGAETINEFTTFGLWYQHNQLQIICDGSNWLKIGPNQLVMIPEASRPTAFILNGGTDRSWTDETGFAAHAPVGTKALLLETVVSWTGNGAYDYAIAGLRQNGSGVTDTHQFTYLVDYKGNAPAAVQQSYQDYIVLCDSDRYIEYITYAASGARAASTLYLGIRGYQQ